MKEILSRLDSEIDSAEWEWIRPHGERGAVVIVDRMLVLAEVGAVIANDDTVTVRGWLASGMISKPSEELMESWDQQPGKRFSMLVVDPFVLVQEQEDGSPERYFA